MGSLQGHIGAERVQTWKSCKEPTSCLAWREHVRALGMEFLQLKMFPHNGGDDGVFSKLWILWYRNGLDRFWNIFLFGGL